MSLPFGKGVLFLLPTFGARIRWGPGRIVGSQDQFAGLQRRRVQQQRPDAAEDIPGHRQDE